jgi:hypothetical protein
MAQDQEINLLSNEDLDAVSGGVTLSYSSIQWVYTNQRSDDGPPPSRTH